MPLLVALFVLCLAMPVIAGALAHRRGWTVAGGLPRWSAVARRRFGRLGATGLVLFGGYAVTAAAGLALGALAKALQSAVDVPVFHWVYARVNPHATGTFTTLNTKLTLFGLNSNDQLIALVAAIVLAFAYRRRWWLPVGALLIAVVGEKYLQKFLGDVIDRGHPPTTLGTYPSGGVARIFAIYGTVVALVILISPALSRAWRAGLWTGVVTMGVVEAYTRVYLSKHWFTDAAFGVLVGTLLLVTNAAAVTTAAGRDHQTGTTAETTGVPVTEAAVRASYPT